MDNNKVALIYGLNEEDLKKVSEKLNNNYKIIEKDMCKMKIRDILNGLRLEVYNCKLPDEKVILFNSFEDEELRMAMTSIKSIVQPTPIFAIVTDTSIDWTFEYLIEHLIEEREWYRKNGK